MSLLDSSTGERIESFRSFLGFVSDGLTEQIQRRSCTFPPQKITTHGDDNGACPPQLEEIIIEDGILCSILSWLPLREAVRTCVLSTRWRDLWTRLPIYRFNARNLVTDQTSKFIESVDSVLSLQHQGGARIEKLWIKFFLHEPHSHHLDAWLRIGVASETKSLILDLSPGFYVRPPAREPYAFPCPLFAKGSSVTHIYLRYCLLRPPRGFDGFNNLETLNLNEIDITGDDLTRLLSNCFNLRALIVWRCHKLVTLTIPRNLSRLVLLTVSNCPQLSNIEIVAGNIMAFNYFGDGGLLDFKVRDSPQLQSANFHFTDENLAYFALTKLSRKLPHLEFLSITGVSKVADLPNGSITFAHLICLSWNINSKASLLCLASLLNAAPSLKKLQLHCVNGTVGKPTRTICILRSIPKHPHACLGKVIISDYCGDQWQIEIARYLLNTATELKLMRIKIQRGRRQSHEQIRAEAIKYLSQKVPTNAKLVIL